MVPSKTQAQAPLRSLDQRMEALKRANDIRVRRAQLKKDLKDGRVQIEGDPARSARVRLDREGLRHAHGRAQVRPRQGGPAAQPVPDQPVEDGGRPLRAPARRARLASSTARAARSPVFVITGPCGAGKGTLIKASARAAARARGRHLRDDPAAAARRGERSRVLVPRRGRVRRADRARARSSSTSSYVGGALRDARAPSSTGSRARAASACSSSRSTARCACRRRSERSVTLFIAADVAGARAPPARARHRELGRDRRADRARPAPARAGLPLPLHGPQRRRRAGDGGARRR